MTDLLVSVIIPVHGAESYLARCVDSVLNQTHRCLDVILVDDGSPDRCGEMCDAYGARDPRVRVVHQQNKGAAAARNAGLDMARGEWLTFVDADDWVHPSLIAHLILAARDTAVDLSVCRFLRVSDASTELGSHLDDHTVPNVRVLTRHDALQLYAGPLASLMTSPWGKLYRNSLFAGKRFPAGRFYEDDFVTYRIVATADALAISDAVLYYYFVHSESLTQVPQDPRRLLDRVDALREQAVFFRAAHQPDSEAEVLRKAFLLQRSLRRPLAQLAAGHSKEQLRQETNAVTVALLRSRASWTIKSLAVVYAALPAAVDAVIDSLHAVRHMPRIYQRNPSATGLAGERYGDAE